MVGFNEMLLIDYNEFLQSVYYPSSKRMKYIYIYGKVGLTQKIFFHIKFHHDEFAVPIF